MQQALDPAEVDTALNTLPDCGVVVRPPGSGLPSFPKFAIKRSILAKRFSLELKS